MKDIRALCQRCINDYREAGFKIFPYTKTDKESCDKCGRLGFVCNVKRGGESAKNHRLD